MVTVIVAPSVVNSLLTGEPFSQTGFVVSGDVEISFHDENLTQISSMHWGNVTVGRMYIKYLWMKVSDQTRIHYFSDNPIWIKYEWFYQGSPGRWSRWNNNSLCYIHSEWMRMMIRLTALSAPEPSFNFDSYFGAV